MKYIKIYKNIYKIYIEYNRTVRKYKKSENTTV